MDYLFKRRKDGFTFYAPSLSKNKKYDVYIDGKRISFGDNRYQQYKDRIGYYKDLDHLDKQRRLRYQQRHQNDNLDKLGPAFFSWNYLW